MSLLTYDYTPLLVDLPDLVRDGTTIKQRARRAGLSLPDTPEQPVVLHVELIPYAALPDGSYGEELTGPARRYLVPRPLVASPLRLVEAATGRILASRFAADNSLLPDADWQAAVQRVADDTAVEALPQNLWFCRMLREQPVVVDAFIEQYIQLAYASGDLS